MASAAVASTCSACNRPWLIRVTWYSTPDAGVFVVAQEVALDLAQIAGSAACPAMRLSSGWTMK